MRPIRTFIAGRNTLLGATLREVLLRHSGCELIDSDIELTDPLEVEELFAIQRPEHVYLIGGQSGGIGWNRARPADLMLDNLRANANVIDAAHRHGVTKLLYLASSCIYPKHAPQPLRVESLGNGPMEPTSESYSTAKFAGWKLCNAYRQQHGCRFITAIPANAFGPHDDFSPQSGHVVASLIHRFHTARLTGQPVLSIWGSGMPRREFIFSRDLANACRFAMEHYEDDAPLNLGSGCELTIAEVARTIAEIVGYRGEIVFDTTQPDGAPRKVLESSPLFAMGWRPRTDFRTAIAETYAWYKQHALSLSVDEYRHQPALTTMISTR